MDDTLMRQTSFNHLLAQPPKMIRWDSSASWQIAECSRSGQHSASSFISSFGSSLELRCELEVYGELQAAIGVSDAVRQGPRRSDASEVSTRSGKVVPAVRGLTQQRHQCP